MAARVRKAVFAAGAAAIAFAVFLLVLRFSPYPALRAFLARPVSSRIYDAHGTLLQVTAVADGVRREFVPLAQIPLSVRRAFIAAEDRRFYEHHGIDWGAVARAAAQNIGAGRTVSGASTMTMQLARIMRPARRRTVLGKVREAFDALRLEARLGKDEILELYLNNVPFGFNTEGVASAARTFFAVPLDELDEVRAACLAVIPRRPARYSPLADPEACARAAFELCSDDNLTLDDFLAVTAAARSFAYPYEMPHFVRWLSAQERSPVGRCADVRTTADAALQHLAEDMLARAVARHADNRLTNGAVLVCDTQSGAILAWAGSADFWDEAHNGQVDGVLAARQPGSSMKPFLYALALERGFAPSSVLPDVPQEFGFERLYVPQNFNNRYNGPVRLRVALASSLNVPAVSLLYELGLPSYLAVLSALRFDSLASADPGLGLALGNAAVSLFELTQAFSVFARDGLFVPLYALADGETARAERVYDENTARIICDMLSDRDARAMGFGYTQTFITPFPSMFKTGTANQYQNITALGATPQYTVGVWMGNFSGETVVGKTGSSVPAKIAHDLLVRLQGRSGKAFAQPAQYRKERVCALSGMKQGAFCPGTVREYVAVGDELAECDWHTAHGTAYPPEYAAWFRLKDRSGSVDARDAPLAIVSPRSGSRFYYDESVPPDRQNIAVEAVGGSADTAAFLVDGQPFVQAARPFVAHVPLVRGVHTVTVRCGGEQADITIEVR